MKIDNCLHLSTTDREKFMINLHATVMRNKSELIKMLFDAGKVKELTCPLGLLDIHYYPIRVKPILECIVNKQEAEGKDVNLKSVTDEFTQLLLNNKIRYAIVSQMVHAEIHAKNIVLDEKNFNGELTSFFDEYKLYMTYDMLNELDQLAKK